MSVKIHNLKPIVAATLLTVTFSLPAMGENALPDDLLGALKQSEPVEARKLADEIVLRWAQSGSPAMDLLLKRGQDAADRGDFNQALGHLTALTDHAPDFAEGWHMRASVYFRTDELGLALHDLEQTLRLNPNHFPALYGFGVIMEQLGKPDLAYKAYQLALAIHPHYEEAQEAMKRLQVQVEGRDL
ncbi:tetratricopeptide repeat protein [Thalassovita sp.]|uniref:tetratricopeptide repeat protein n=1 Tax=Thalassovita sp. TaxID=1979401 RepID=UPI0029DE83C9|nr:tetratricopeptide repeat protein [Thalassovita sp.]